MIFTRRAFEELIRNLLVLSLPLVLILFGQYNLTGGIPAMLRSLLLIPLYFAALPLRSRGIKIWQSILFCFGYLSFMTLLGGAVPATLSDTVLQDLPFLQWIQPVFFGLFGLFAVSVFIFEKMQRPIEIRIGYLLVTQIGVFVLYMNTSMSVLRTALFIYSLVLLVLYIVHVQIRNFNKSMRRYIETGKQPVDRIRRFVSRVFLGFLGLFIAAALLAPYGAMIVNAVLRTLLSGIRFVMSRLNLGGDMEYEFTTFLPEFFDQGAINDPPLPAGDPGWFSRVLLFLFNAVLYVTVAVILAFILFALISAIARFYKNYYAVRNSDGDVRVRLEHTAKADKDPPSIDTSARRPRKGLLTRPSDKIRRLFIHTVERSSVSIRKADTARSLSLKIQDTKHKDLSELTALYEQARYGRDGAVQDEDVRRIRNVLKGK